MPHPKKSKEPKPKTQSKDIFVTPFANGVNLVSAIKKIPTNDLEKVVNRLRATNQQVIQGNLNHIEDMLLNQAHTLEAVFYSCTEKMLCSEYLNQTRVYSEIALKAQKQCRSTVMAISELKNPKKTTFVKQQNNAVNQQINHLEKNLNPTNELMEITHEPVDSRAPARTITEYPQVEALDEVDRSQNCRR